jgi:hypothetical protein
VQLVALHSHDAAPAATTQVWFAPHPSAVTQPVQPFVPVTQLWTEPLAHWVAPSMHAFVQHAAEPAEPEQAPLLHV